MQSRDDLDLTAGPGIAVREFPMKSGFGFADYLLYLDRKAVGAVEAKAEGTLTGVEAQSAKYAAGLPDNLPAHKSSAARSCSSPTAPVTYFTNGLDPTPRSRQVFNFPRPETLAEWVAQAGATARPPARSCRRSTSRGLWKVQARAIRNLEDSFADADPRALIQMATGSGKTFTAVNVAYRLLKFGGAKRILFLVDRGNLGKQTEDEFANFEPPDDPRKFPTLYTVQRLKTNSINPAAKVVITTIQRLYSMLKGEAEFDPGNEEGSAFDSARPWQGEPPDVVYNAGIPPEFFDFIIVDECHRSIYELWSQVLLYFDSFLDRPHRHARRQDHRLLQSEPCHAVRPRRGGDRRRERGLRRLPHPHPHHRAGRHHRGARYRRLRGQAPQAHPRRAAATAQSGPHLHRQPARPRCGLGKPDTHCASSSSGTMCCPTPSPAARRCPRP